MNNLELVIDSNCFYLVIILYQYSKTPAQLRTPSGISAILYSSGFCVRERGVGLCGLCVWVLGVDLGLGG